MPDTSSTAVAPAGAAADAAAAADRAGVTVRELTALDEFVAASSLLSRVWGTPAEQSPLPSDLLASFAHAGACLLGAYSGGDLVGLTVGIAGSPGSHELYSLIAASAPEVAGRGVGAALKFGQRAWALDRGADRLIWTFDPLIRRNAHFNITKLGAGVAEYRTDFYPPMHDAINRTDLTDRLVAVWDLNRPANGSPDTRDTGGSVELVGIDQEQRPVRREVGDVHRVAVRVPFDIEQIRRNDPSLAREWRLAVRDSLQPLLLRGFSIMAFARDGAYVLEVPDHD